MNITINGNVTINTTETTEATETTGTTETTQVAKTAEAQKEERQPIDRTNEVLIPNETSFFELINILRRKPEAIEASLIEAEEKEREAREAEEGRKRRAYGEDYELIFGEKKNKAEELEKADRRPGSAYLRKYEPMLAKIEFVSGGFCEVFANAYAVYDNGNRKCVVWVPDCGSATYYFGPLKDNEKEYLDQRKELGEDELGPLPWYNALIIAGEDRIEYNMTHPKTKGSASDTENPEEWEKKGNYRWSCGARIENPEEAYLKKEAAAERRNALSEKQREAYILYYEENLTVEEIAEELGITPAAVSYRLRDARSRFGKNIEKYFS